MLFASSGTTYQLLLFLIFATAFHRFLRPCLHSFSSSPTTTLAKGVRHTNQNLRMEIPVEDDDLVRPFEWLTSAESLKPKLQQALVHKENARVLHVGCGSSVLGEFLAENFANVAQVVNLDNDQETVQAMQKRWTKFCGQRRYDEQMRDRMKFIALDMCQESIPQMDGSFDLVLDKSTLDCLLCSDKGASCLLSETHRLLDPKDGVYLLISFHHMDMLRPLLQDCPGTDWNLTHSVVYRHVETLGACATSRDGPPPLLTVDVGRISTRRGVPSDS